MFMAFKYKRYSSFCFFMKSLFHVEKDHLDDKKNVPLTTNQ